jgi:excisionase family DNA binding protein
MAQDVAPRTMNRRQAAGYLGISVATLDRLASTGSLLPVRISPRIVRYRATDLDAYLESLTPTRTS